MYVLFKYFMTTFCWDIEMIYFLKVLNLRKFVMFITAVCVLFFIKLRWPKNKSLYLFIIRDYSSCIQDKHNGDNGVDRPARLSRTCFSLNESFCPRGYIF